LLGLPSFLLSQKQVISMVTAGEIGTKPDSPLEVNDAGNG
jgi:hypothetical protein